MNKKEVSEIKSLFKRDGGAIDRICGCLIDGEQQIRMTFSDMFLITRLIRNFRGKAISV